MILEDVDTLLIYLGTQEPKGRDYVLTYQHNKTTRTLKVRTLNECKNGDVVATTGLGKALEGFDDLFLAFRTVFPHAHIYTYKGKNGRQEGFEMSVPHTPDNVAYTEDLIPWIMRQT